MLAYCSPSSKWVPGDNTGEIRAARKGNGHPTSDADGLEVANHSASYNVLVYNRPQATCWIKHL